MTEREDLYTDYALQIFSSYIKEDMESMALILESFKNDGKNIDDMFMPGLIYGLLYHMATFVKLVSVGTEQPVERILSDYAMDYAIAREDLLANPLLNVYKARKLLEEILRSTSELEDLFNEDNDNDL